MRRSTTPRRLIAAVVILSMGAGFAVGGVGAWRAATAQRGLQIKGAVIVQPPGGRDIAAGYLTIRSDRDDRLVAVRSEMVGHIEMHRSTAAHGRVRMERLDSVALPAGEPVVFAPAGLHLMLFGVGPLGPGRTVDVVLQTASGRVGQASFAVVTRPP